MHTHHALWYCCICMSTGCHWKMKHPDSSTSLVLSYTFILGAWATEGGDFLPLVHGSHAPACTHAHTTLHKPGMLVLLYLPDDGKCRVASDGSEGHSIVLYTQHSLYSIEHLSVTDTMPSGNSLHMPRNGVPKDETFRRFLRVNFTLSYSKHAHANTHTHTHTHTLVAVHDQ